VDVVTTLKVRCEAIGLQDAATPPTETIRVPAPEDLALAHAPTMASDRPPDASARELPKISVELRGTLSGPADERDTVTGPKGERDLEVIRTLGEGGMGRVFLARQHSLDREVAIKTVRDTASDKERDALLTEGAVVGHLEHPGVVPVHALGVDVDGRPVLVMKRVEGAPWSELLADPDHPAWQYLGGDPGDRQDGHLAILMQVCNAADFAHSRGILHRDIKPQNVLIGRYGEVYLADWGLALREEAWKTSQPLCGTPAYMAPEMVTGSPLDARTDVYLLGATLHHILTGMPRHSASDVRATLLAAAASLPVTYRRSVPEALGQLANAATSADPEQRPASPADLRQALADYLRHRSSIALAETAVERLARLRMLVGDVEGLGSEAWQREIDVRGAETGFALDQALREWSDNPVARRAAAELEQLLGSRRSRAAELERFAHELDPRVSSRQRLIGIVALALVGAGLSVSSFVVDSHDVTTRALLYQSFGPLGAVAVAAFALRRHLLRTVLNRRVTASFLGVTALVSANRALGLLAGVPGPQVLVFDCVACAVLCGLGAVVFFRWVAWISAIMLAAAVVAAAAPDRAMSAFSAGSGIGLLIALFFVSRAARGR